MSIEVKLKWTKTDLGGETYRIKSVNPDRGIEKGEFIGVLVSMVGLDEFRNVSVLPHLLVSSYCLFKYMTQIFFTASMISEATPIPSLSPPKCFPSFLEASALPFSSHTSSRNSPGTSSFSSPCLGSCAPIFSWQQRQSIRCIGRTRL